MLLMLTDLISTQCEMYEYLMQGLNVGTILRNNEKCK